MSLAELGNETYVSLETFRKNGTGIKTPVWVTGENGRLYVVTQADAWKIKRINNNGRVRVAKCDVRGNVQGEWVDAQARVLTDAAALTAQTRRGNGKYGLMYRLFSLMARLRGNKRAVIEIVA
ncbi:MAG: PPOX class F420-dependent oxidoreductase [Chloroflexota bacterium]